MIFLLSSLNSTQSRASAIRDYIRLGFSITPNDIRYDELPNINRTITSIDQLSRDAIIKTRLMDLVNKISSDMSVPVDFINYEEIGNKITISLRVREELLKFVL